MTQTGGTHGPHTDDALKKEVRSELQANRATRAEEWLEPEPPGDDQPEATWALQGRPGTEYGPDPDAIELRSDLARHLGKMAFPGRRAHLIQTLAEYQAPQQLIDLVEQLPGNVTYGSLHEVLVALGLPVDSRGS